MEPNNNNSNKRITWNEQDFPAPEKPEIGIEFYNVNSGETRVCDSEALITAFYNSSNLHVNAAVGQDIGWRLAKETIRRMRNIQDDEDELERIVRKFRLNDETEITDSHILTYMFQKDLRRKQREESSKQNSHRAQYERDLQDLDLEAHVDTEEDELDDQPAGPRRTTATSAPARRLSPRDAKLLADAQKREANIEAGRPINEGIEGADEALTAAVANDDDALTEEEQTAKDEAELAELQKQEDAEKEAAKLKPATPNKPVAKPRTKSDNKSNS